MEKSIELFKHLNTDMFSKLHFIMSPLVNIYVPVSQEKPLNRSTKPPSHLKGQRSISWHNYIDLRQRHGKSFRDSWSSFDIF